MNVSIDLGNIWDMLSAVGTVGAVVLSMWLIRKESKTDISILIGFDYITHEISSGITGSSMDRMIKINAYNSEKKATGVSFIGFGVGIKKQSFLKRVFNKNNLEFSTYISTIDKLFENPEMELIEPGKMTKEYLMECQYLYDVGSSYAESNGDLLVTAEVQDFNGKRYYGKIIMGNPS